MLPFVEESVILKFNLLRVNCRVYICPSHRIRLRGVPSPYPGFHSSPPSKIIRFIVVQLSRNHFFFSFCIFAFNPIVFLFLSFSSRARFGGKGNFLIEIYLFFALLADAASSTVRECEFLIREKKESYAGVVERNFSRLDFS